ncbi:MAG: type II secretion system protein N [Gammaproteobacteria bacterium]|nr:type II secretion system protein N [Gammaproteobacteria bacterium]
MKKKIKLNKGWTGFIVLGVVAYVYFMLVNFPAAAAYQYFVASMDRGKKVNLQGLSGTLWQGQAAQARIASLNFGKLNWDLQLLSLFTGKLGLDLLTAGNNSRIEGSAKAGFDQTLYVDGLQGKIPAAMLMPLFYGFPIAIDGQINADIKQAEIKQGKKLSVEGKLVWHGAKLTAPQAVELGDLFVALRPDANGTKLLLSDQGGPLTLDGTVMVKHNGQYKINIYLGTKDKSQPALSNGLKMMGRTNPQGKVLVSRTGQLRNWR